MYEPAFQREYGLDLAATLRTAPISRVCALVRGLTPAGSSPAVAGADRQAATRQRRTPAAGPLFDADGQVTGDLADVVTHRRVP